MQTAKIQKRIEKEGVYNPPLFMYGHFIFDCLVPDILSGYDRFDLIYRQNSFYETLGSLKPIYEEVLRCRLIEVSPHEYQQLDGVDEFFTDQIQSISERLLPSTVHTVRKYIHDCCEQHTPLKGSYPKVLLIKRGHLKQRINDKQQIDVRDASGLIDKGLVRKWIPPHLKNTDPLQFVCGPASERRETLHIERLNAVLSDQFEHYFEEVILEDLTFFEQINYFKSAKLIIGCHGAGFANLLFSQKNTTMIEIKQTDYSDFKDICKYLDIRYESVHENQDVVSFIESNVRKIKQEILQIT